MRVILLMTIGLILVQSTQAQSQLDSLRAPFDSLDTKYFPSKILHNRSPYYFNSFGFDTINGNLNLDTNFKASPYFYESGIAKMKRSAFFRIYREMLYSANDTNVLITPPNYFNTRESLLDQYEMPISIMAIDFHRLNEQALKNQQLWFDTINQVYTIMPDTLFFPDTIVTPDTVIVNPGGSTYRTYPNTEQLAYSAFFNQQVHGSYACRDVLYKSSNQFSIQYYLDSNLFISNIKNLDYLSIDFGNGQGFQNVNWNSAVNISYELPESPKIQSIKVKITLPGHNQDVTIELEINVVVFAELPDVEFTTDTLNYECNVQPTNTDAIAKVSIRYADTTTLTLNKPIIFVEGFESSLEDYGELSYINLVNGNVPSYPQLAKIPVLFDTMNQLGYDIIYLEYKDPTDTIEKDAYALIKVIQWANKQLQVNGSNEKLVILGASMGGIIARYALRKIEMDGCCHNTRLYVSFDAPHEGTNVPIGIQKFLKYAAETSQSWNGVSWPISWTSMAPDFNNEIVELKWHTVLDRGAARQMLVYHAGNNALQDHINWQNTLDSMGYPESCRRIALMNGNELGNNNGIEDAYKRIIGTGEEKWLPKQWIILPPPVNNALPSSPLLIPTIWSKYDFAYSLTYTSSKNDVFVHNEWAESVITGNSIYRNAMIYSGINITSAIIGNAWLPSYPFMEGVTIASKTYGSYLLLKGHADNAGFTHHSSNPYPIDYTIAPGSRSNSAEEIEEASDGVVQLYSKFHTFMFSPTTLGLKNVPVNANIKDLYLQNQNITEFNCYWAPNRNEQLYDSSYKSLHITVNDDNSAWIKEQLLNDWELRASNGEYKGELLGYYNYGRSNAGTLNDNIELINKPHQTILYSLNIENNGQLFVNKQDVIGLSTGTLYPRPGSTFKLKTNSEPCDTTIVRIKDGGKFVIGEENNGVLNKGEVHFCKNSTLEIFGGGSLIIRDSSRLIIEDGANLIIHSGAVVILEGTASILELKGKVIIKDNAVLAPQGDGFIRFAAKMNASNINDHWQAGNESSLVLANYTGTQTKKGEVVENTYFPDNLKQFYINTIVELDSMITLNSYGSIQAQYSLFTAIDSNKFYNAVKIYGQPNTRFGSCEFRNGNYGLSAQMSYGGSTFTLDTCKFTKNYIGLYTSDEYIFINKCDFTGNLDYGWKAENMQSNCDVTNSIFDDNGFAGAYFNGQGNVMLNINWAKFRNNYQHGLEISEATLNSSCSKYQSNGQSGIFAKENAEVDISDNKRNQITNNYTGILLDKALTLNIEHGFNNFTGNQYFIVGEVKPDNYYQGLSTATPISLLYNLLPAPSASQMPINIYLTEPQYGNQITVPLFDWTQNLSSFETYCISSYIPANFNNYQMFEGKISISVISTSHFQNTYLIDAFKTAAMQMSYGEEYIGNDTLAIALFKEIFDNIPANVNEDEHSAIDDALNQMISALTYAIEHELINPNRALDGMPVDEYVAMIADEIQNRLDDIEYANMYAEEQEAYYQLLLAQMYRAAEHYDYALAILQNDNYFFNTTLKNQADYWNCVCMAENLLLKDSIERSEYEARIDSCHEMSTAKQGGFHPVFGTNSVNLDEESNLLVAIYPNPAEQLIAVEFSYRIEEATVELTDITGKLIWSTHQIVKGKQIRLKLPEINSGTYMLKTTTENRVYNNKVIIR